MSEATDTAGRATDDCAGVDGLICIDGWLYSGINMMIFPTNRRCPRHPVKVRSVILETGSSPLEGG